MGTWALLFPYQKMRLMFQQNLETISSTMATCCHKRAPKHSSENVPRGQNREEWEEGAQHVNCQCSSVCTLNSLEDFRVWFRSIFSSTNRLQFMYHIYLMQANGKIRTASLYSAEYRICRCYKISKS